MADERPTPRRNLESLKKEAKRWLAALRDDDPDARARLARATPNPPDEPALRDVQLALAREHGFAGWSDLKDAIESQGSKPGMLAAYEDMADALLQAYRTGTPEAMERHYRLTWHRRGRRAAAGRGRLGHRLQLHRRRPQIGRASCRERV